METNAVFVHIVVRSSMNDSWDVFLESLLFPGMTACTFAAVCSAASSFQEQRIINVFRRKIPPACD